MFPLINDEASFSQREAAVKVDVRFQFVVFFLYYIFVDLRSLVVNASGAVEGVYMTHPEFYNVSVNAAFRDSCLSLEKLAQLVGDEAFKQSAKLRLAMFL